MFIYFWQSKLGKKKDNSDNKDANESNIGQFDDSTFQPQMDEDSNDNTESLQVTDNQKGGRGIEMEEEPEVDSDAEVQIMGVDQAILHSIDKCGMHVVNIQNHFLLNSQIFFISVNISRFSLQVNFLLYSSNIPCRQWRDQEEDVQLYRGGGGWHDVGGGPAVATVPGLGGDAPSVPPHAGNHGRSHSTKGQSVR